MLQFEWTKILVLTAYEKEQLSEWETRSSLNQKSLLLNKLIVMLNAGTRVLRTPVVDTNLVTFSVFQTLRILGCIQKFPD
jgi:hypothetical protein